MICALKRLPEAQHASRNLDMIAAVAIFGTVFLTYSVVVFNTFGVLDDWYFLHNAITGQVGTVPLLIGAGRPLNAFILDMGFSVAGSVEGLAALRLITIIGISFLGFFLYKFSRTQNIDAFSSLLIATGVVLLPSFHVYASWAQHFTTPYAGMLALFSAYILTPGSRFDNRSRIFSVTFSAIVLLVSLLVYQPLAMLFWAGILISFIAAFDTNNQWRFERIMNVLVAFLTSMIAAFVALKIGQLQYPSGSSRYGLVEDIYGKLIWFVSEPLANAVSLYSVPRSSVINWLVATVFFVCFLFLGKCRGLKFSAKLFLVIVLAVLFSYIPNLATAENWASYRSTGALAATVIISVLLVLRLTIKCALEKNILKKGLGSYILAPLCVLAGAFVFLSSLAQSSVYKGFVLPNVIELNNLAGVLKQNATSISKDQAILVKTSSWQDSSAAVLLYDEFGMHSSLRDYYSVAIVKTVLRSMGLGVDSRVTLYSDELAKSGAVDDDALIIDFPQMVNSERFKSNFTDWKAVNLKKLYPANINDENWSGGIWANSETPGIYSFTYKRRYGDADFSIGDSLLFNGSGSRKIIKIEVGKSYTNILVDGGALEPRDGFPHAVRIEGTSVLTQ